VVALVAAPAATLARQPLCEPAPVLGVLMLARELLVLAAPARVGSDDVPGVQGGIIGMPSFVGSATTIALISAVTVLVDAAGEE